jgi:lactoylglutathione lyase
MKISHMAAYVRDLEKTRLFYETYFNAKAGELYHNPKTGFRSYFLSFEGEARYEIMSKLGICAIDVSTEHMGYIHLAISVGSKEAVDRLTERLRIDGYAVLSEPRTTGDGYYESCVADADGNRIEIVE